MYKIDVQGKKLEKLIPKRFSELGFMERFDVQEWVEKSPEILGEDLLIIAKELILPSGLRPDLLAIDKKANLVVIELKRDESGSSIEWQAIKYASYCSTISSEEIFSYFAIYLKSDKEEAQEKIEAFIEEDIENLNAKQRIFLVAKDFHQDVISAVLWLRDYKLDIKCIRLRSYIDEDLDVFITPDIIIPLPEAKDYIERKETKQQAARDPSIYSSFSLEKGNFSEEELHEKLRETLDRKSDLTPRFITLLEILLSENRVFEREEIKRKLFEKEVGEDLGQTGRYLSNLSQFLTKKSTPHLRQMIDFETGGGLGETKDNYRIVPEYRHIIQEEINKWKSQNDTFD